MAYMNIRISRRSTEGKCVFLGKCVLQSVREYVTADSYQYTKSLSTGSATEDLIALSYAAKEITGMQRYKLLNYQHC